MDLSRPMLNSSISNSAKDGEEKLENGSRLLTVESPSMNLRNSLSSQALESAVSKMPLDHLIRTLIMMTMMRMMMKMIMTMDTMMEVMTTKIMPMKAIMIITEMMMDITMMDTTMTMDITMEVMMTITETMMDTTMEVMTNTTTDNRTYTCLIIRIVNSYINNEI